jgi:NhaP-type Na+/H+ or K+/H+ antiporter
MYPKIHPISIHIIKGLKMVASKKKDEEKLFRGILRLNTQIIGLVLGVLIGLAIFVATNWLVIRGGHLTPDGRYVVGPHLKLLNQFFIGYRVSFLGSIIGFFYGFVIGTLSGAAIGWIYNKIVDFRN